jgi:hypothetical protein
MYCTNGTTKDKYWWKYIVERVDMGKKIEII